MSPLPPPLPPALRPALLLNALSCAGFGAVLALQPGAVAAFLGAAPPGLLRLLGLLLLVNAAHLVIAARRPRPFWPEVLWFSLADLAWWLGSLGLVAAGLWVTTPQGIAATLAVAAMVAALGVTQLFALGQARSGLAGTALWRRLGHSCLALRPGVKLWLALLNLAFLAAPAFWPAPAATLPLLAYVATGPLLLGMAVAQGGLTRALGLAHLLPFGALLLWSVPQAATADGAGAAYLALLSAVVAICLALDLWDLARYRAGDRAPF